MTDVERISTLDRPELQPYRTLRRAADHVQHGIFVAEGEKVVRRLLESDLPVVSVLLTQAWFTQLKGLIEARTKDHVKVFIADKRMLESIVGFRLHQGIMAVGKIPESCSLEGIVGKKTVSHFLVAVDGIANSENLGVIVRNCAAFGVHGLLVGETSSSPYLRRAVRMSMGAIFRLPVVHVRNLALTLTELRTTYGTRTLAAHPRSDGHIADAADYAGKICIVFGSEGPGISPAVLHACQEQVTIPMTASTDSLNVASASAILLYEAATKRKE